MFIDGAMAAAVGWFDRHKLRRLSASLRDTSLQDRSTRSDQVAGEADIKRENGDRMVWIDGVGGFLLTLADELTIGQPRSTSDERGAQLTILADLSRRHATIRRESGAYVLTPGGTTSVDGKPIDSPTLLTGGEEVRLGESVRLRFTRPHALSATGKLVIESGHRFAPAADAVILMAESCVLGPKPHSHVRCHGWDHEAILFRSAEGLRCRSDDQLQLNGKPHGKTAPASPGSKIEGQDFSLSIECVGEKS